MWLFIYLVVGLLAASFIALLLPRAMCLYIALIGLFLGLVFPLLLWGYASWFVQGDQSSYGMLGVISMMWFLPGSLLLAVLTLIKG